MSGGPPDPPPKVNAARSHPGVKKQRAKKDKDKTVPLHEFMQRQAKEARDARANFERDASDNEAESEDDEPDREGQPEEKKMEMAMCGWTSKQLSNCNHRTVLSRPHRCGPLCPRQRPTRMHGPSSRRE